MPVWLLRVLPGASIVGLSWSVVPVLVGAEFLLQRLRGFGGLEGVSPGRCQCALLPGVAKGSIHLAGIWQCVPASQLWIRYVYLVAGGATFEATASRVSMIALFVHGCGRAR